MIQVRQGDRTVRLTVDEFERRVREGRVAPDAEVCLPAVTGDRFVPAGELDYVRALARDPTRRWHEAITAVRAPWLTALLVGAQVRLWGWLQLPEGAALLDRGARDTQAILEGGELWRWGTSGLLQVEFGHMAMNLLFLGWVGVHLEAAMGWRALALLFGASVWGGAVLSTFVSPAADAIGSSGGVFGLVGAGVVLGVLRPAELPPRLRGVFGWSLLPYLLQGLISGFFTPRIDNAGHLGGLVVGVVLMLALTPPALQRRPGRNRAVTAAALTLIALVSAAIALRGPAWAPIAPVEEATAEIRALADDAVELPPPPPRALVAHVPRGWRPATLLDGQRGVASEVGHAAWAVWEVQAPRPWTPEALAAAWAARVASRVDVAPTLLSSAPCALAGRPATCRVERVALEDSPSEAVEVSWAAAVRGRTALVAVWEVDAARAARMAPLHDRLLAAVTWGDPPEFVEARDDIAAVPEAPDRQVRWILAQDLVGDVEGALRDARAHVASHPSSPRAWRTLLHLITVWPDHAAWGGPGPALTEIDRALDAARAHTVDASVLAEASRALRALGRDDEAWGLLDLAWAASPGERELAAARAELGLPTAPDAPALASPRTPWTRAAAAPLGATLRARRDALADELAARWPPTDAAARATLLDLTLRLATGSPVPAPRHADAVAALRAELEAARHLPAADQAAALPWWRPGLPDPGALLDALAAGETLPDPARGLP